MLKKDYFFTRRQWALLTSTLVFILTAAITTCAVLGTIHSREVLKLLRDDIRQESENEFASSKTYDGKTSNESMLYSSVDFVMTLTKVLSIFMWISWGNLICAGILIYGVTTKSSLCIIPWLLVSLASYIAVTLFLFCGYYQIIQGFYVAYKILVITITSGILFGAMWYSISLYYRMLNPGPLRPMPKVYQAYGGYTHTIEPSLQNIPKV